MYKQSLTLFRSPEQSLAFRALINTALENPVIAGLTANADNLYSVADLIKYTHLAMPALQYCDIEHITEIYLRYGKEEHYSFQFEKGQFGLSYGKKSVPPEKLYFGTLKHMCARIDATGIKKKTICLSESREAASSQAIQFLKYPNDVATVYVIDALRAYEDGMCSFSSSDETSDWYCANLIPKEYISELRNS